MVSVFECGLALLVLLLICIAYVRLEVKLVSLQREIDKLVLTSNAKSEDASLSMEFKLKDLERNFDDKINSLSNEIDNAMEEAEVSVREIVSDVDKSFKESYGQTDEQIRLLEERLELSVKDWNERMASVDREFDGRLVDYAHDLHIEVDALHEKLHSLAPKGTSLNPIDPLAG